MPAVTRRTSSTVMDSPSPAPSALAPVASTPTRLKSATLPVFVPATPSSPSSTPSRPLCPAKIVAATGGPGPVSSTSRRFRVVFSPQLAHTKLFHATDPLPPASSTTSSPALARRSASPLARGILKPSPSEILVAKSAKEGTWNNREAARRIVAGDKPGAFYSAMVLAELCDGAEDGVAPKVPSDDDPDSDDTPDNNEAFPNAAGSDASEEEEELECLHPSSLVSVILDGAEDLLTLEEAYTSLALRIRDVMFHMGPASMATQHRFDTVWGPIADEASAVVCAIQRDIDRLMGRVPHAEMDPSSSPFRGIASNSGLPPSPTKSSKTGYTASEVLYRREAAGVGGAVLRLLAVVFSHPRLYSVFSQADVQLLLDKVLPIMRSPTLPTPFAKRTYTLTLAILSNLNLPLSYVQHMDGKLLSAVMSGLTTIGFGQPTIKDPSTIRKESYSAAANLLRRYPSIMFQSYATLLPYCLRAFYSQSKVFKRCGVAVAAMFANAKMQLLEEADWSTTDKFEWNKLRTLIAKSETFVANHLKLPLRTNQNKAVLDKKTGEKTTEGGQICSTFKATIGESAHVAWACTAWAVLATLLGHTYNTSSLAQEIDHIMDRSLYVSTNTVRPKLATAAWLHGVYAYLQAGASTSVTEAGQLARSYSPFVASSYQDVTARLNTIMTPARYSLREALAPSNITRALITRSEFNNEQRWSWQRAEKIRKYTWMVSTGMSTAAIVYAYTVVSLVHEDAPAAEVSRVSGILSSDGVAPDTTPDERRLPRLDRTFELVLCPILQQMFDICGVDELKATGWEIFAAITSDSPAGRVPGLDRLLSKRYLTADIVGLEEVTQQMLGRFDRERIHPDEIPGWGKFWIAKRLGKLLTLFQSAVDGIRGINELVAVEWVKNGDGLVLLPKVLSDVWDNLLEALASTNTSDVPTPLFGLGLREIARTIIQIFDKDPAEYIPICLLNAETKSTLDSSAIRLGITLHLYNAAVKVLGEAALGGQSIDIKVSGLETAAFSAEPIGKPTVAGHLLGHLLSYKSFPSSLDPKVSPLFTSFVSSLLDSGCSRDLGTTLLGDLTNKIPFIFEGCEPLQLNVWRLLALKWSSVVDLEPTEVASQKTNHTGDLLTTLLSCPFRNTSPESTWYTKASIEDLEAWEGLLKVTVLRFRAKRAGSNFGVMETLAAHIGDFVRINEDDLCDETRSRRGSDTTLHCLAEAAVWVNLVQKEHYHADHYNINENYIPIDFLSLVSSGLADAYRAKEVPHKVTDVVENLTALLTDLPTDAVADVMEAIRPGIASWMTDADRRVSPILNTKIDALYVAVLDDLTRAIESRAIPAAPETMDTYIDLYAPRLSRASDSSVPTAFQTLWHRAFEPLGAVGYSDDVAGFLRDVMAAVPGFIIADGLSSLESSQGEYPYAASVPALPIAAEEVEEVEEVEEDEVEREASLAADDAVIVPQTTTPDVAEEYDADVSQSPTKKSKTTRHAIVPPSTSPADADVFGPKSSARRRKSRRPARDRSDGTGTPASASSTPGPADRTMIADTPLQEDDDDTPVRLTCPAPAAEERGGSLFSSASRWLRRVPSMLSFGASDESIPVSSPVGEADESPAPSRNRRKRRRERSATETDFVDLTQNSPEPEVQPQPTLTLAAASPEMPTSAQPTPRTRLARQRSHTGRLSAQPSRPSTPVSTPAAESSAPVLTRSAARKRDEDDSQSSQSQSSSQSSQRKSKRRRRTRGNPDDDEDPLLLSPESAAKMQREEKEARASAEREIRAAERKAKEANALKEQQKREERDRKERARVEKEEREARELFEREETEREAARIEAERIEAERLEKERLEKERLEKERLEAERLEKERLARLAELQRLEDERIERERLARIEAERLEKERLEAERLEKERLEAERIEQERLEAERLEKERLEAERLERIRLDKERREQERQERLARLEQIERERQAREELERKQKQLAELAALKAAAEQDEKEERERMETLERERAEAEATAAAEAQAKADAEAEAAAAAARTKSARKTRGSGKGKSRASQSVSVSPAPSLEAEIQVSATPEISGRFDDAPGDLTPRATRQSLRTGRTAAAVPTTPPSASAGPSASQEAPTSTPIRRSSRQNRVLEMVSAAAADEELAAIADMDMDAVIDLMGNIDKLRAAATAKLQQHAMAAREDRRRARRRG